MAGGPGPGLVAVESIQGLVGNLYTYGLQAALLTEPAAPAATIRLVGGRRCRTPGRACRTNRTVQLTVRPRPSTGWIRLTVERLRAGSWHRVRSALVRVRGKSAIAKMSLPSGHVRVSTAAADTRPHPWAAYLTVR